MSELYMMVTITNRQLTRKFVECYKEKGAQVGSVTVGMGTAANEILDYFGAGRGSLRRPFLDEPFHPRPVFLIHFLCSQDLRTDQSV